MLRAWSVDSIRWLFLVAALYDIVLGAAFTFFHDPVLDALDIVPPDNNSYIHLASAFVLVQGLTYLIVVADVERNTGLMLAGILYKAGYVAVAFYYLAIDELLHWVFFAFGLADLAFLVAFAGALAAVRRGAPARS